MNNNIITITDEQLKAFINVNIPTMRYYWKYTSKAPFLLYKDPITKNDIIPLTKEMVIKHINGVETHGYASFIDNKNILFLGIDIDTHIKDDSTDNEIEKIENTAKETLNDIISWLKKDGYLFLVYSSGSNGRHIQIYSNKPMNAKTAILWLEYNLTEIVKLKSLPEIFPKQYELNDNVPFGSQMKAPLALHLKHNKRALVLNEHGVELSLQESLDYFVDFEKKIINAKPIEFVITPEIESKYYKKVLSPEQLEILKEQPIPKHCAFIEDIATKLVIPSQGGVNRHSHIDGNVYQYCAANNKHELFEEYCDKQERNSSAFNGAENWVFSCGAIQKYIQHYQDDTLIKLCEGLCYKCELNKKEIKEESIKENVKNLIHEVNDNDNNKNKIICDTLKLSLNLNVLDQDEIIEKLHIRTKVKTSSIRDMLKTFKSDELIKNKSLKTKYSDVIELEKSPGYYFLTYSDDKGKKELMLFNNDLKYMDYNMFDPQTRKYKNEKYIKVLQEGVDLKFRLTKSSSDLSKVLLKTFAPTTQYRMYQTKKIIEPIYDWLENKFEDDAKINGFYVSKNATWCFGAYIVDKKIKIIMNNGDCDLVIPEKYSLSNEKILEIMVREELNISKAICSDEEIIKFLEIIKYVPKTDEGRKKWWNLLAFSLSTPLKTVFSDCGVQLFPEVLLLGQKQVGKTQVYMKFLVQAFWGSLESGNSDTMTGTTAKIINKLTGTLRPQVFDEIVGFNDKLQNLLKETATTGDGVGAEIIRNNTNNEPRVGIITRPLFMSANTFKINDDAMRDRIYTILFQKNSREDNNEIHFDDMAFLKSLTNNNPGFLTKHIYNIYENLDVDLIEKTVQKNTEKYPKNNRLSDLQTHLDIGLLIIEKLYIKFNLDKPNFSDVVLFDQQSDDMIVNTEKTGLESLFFELINNVYVTVEITDGGFNRERKITIFDFIKKLPYMCDGIKIESEPFNVIKDPTSELIRDILEKFMMHGIGFTCDDNLKIIEVVLFDKFRSKLNKTTNIEAISNLSKLSDNLNAFGMKNIHIGSTRAIPILSGYVDTIQRKQKRNNILLSLKENKLFETLSDDVLDVETQESKDDVLDVETQEKKDDDVLDVETQEKKDDDEKNVFPGFRF